MVSRPRSPKIAGGLFFPSDPVPETETKKRGPPNPGGKYAFKAPPGGPFCYSTRSGGSPQLLRTKSGGYPQEYRWSHLGQNLVVGGFSNGKPPQFAENCRGARSRRTKETSLLLTRSRGPPNPEGKFVFKAPPRGPFCYSTRSGGSPQLLRTKTWA